MRQILSARSIFTLPLLACLLGPQSVKAAVIGVVAPSSGPYARLGEQIQHGAGAALGEGNQIVSIQETCEPGSGKQVAEQLKSQGVSIAVGFLCVETLTDVLPALKGIDIPAITVSVRSRILSEDAERQGWPFFRLAPVEGQEAAAIADVILKSWQNQPIALIDDGTIYARDLIAAVRSRIEAGGIKPVFTDTFRPGQEQQLSLVRRLAKAGATRIIVGGDRSDIAIMARDADKDGAKLTFVGGDVLRAANRPIALPEGVMAVALPDFSKEVEADSAVSILRVGGVDPDGYTLPAFAAVQVAEQALTSARSSGISTVEALKRDVVSTVIGPIDFQPNGELKQNLFRLQRWQQNGWALDQPPTE